jgi:hypothetical protein
VIQEDVATQHLEVILELKKTIVAHEEVQHKKKVTNKRVGRIKTHMVERDYLKRYYQERVSYNNKKTFKLLKNPSS